MRKRVRRWLGRLNIKYLVTSLILLVGIFFVYFWHLSKLTPGLSPAENSARIGSGSLHTILLNPVNAPQRVLQYLAQKAGYHGVFSMRLASVIMALLFVASVFWLMKSWFGLTISIYTTLMFATTPLIILLARSATANIMLLSPAAVLAAYVWLSKREHRPDRAWFILITVSALSLYTPGMIWLFVLGLIILHRRILSWALLVNRRSLIFSLVIFLLLLAPLLWALVKNIDIFHDLLLIPRHWLGLLGTAKSIGWALSGLLWHARVHNPLIISRLPLLSILQVALVVFGTYIMWVRARNQTLSLLGLVVISIVLAGINNNLILLSLSLPALALLSAAGLRYLYIEWRGIFPRNPLPLGFAMVLISALVGLQVVYGLRYSLIAWPHTSATKQLYVLK